MEQNNFEIPIFYGTYADLTKIDLSFINFNIVNFNGIKFRQFVRSIVSPKFLFTHITSFLGILIKTTLMSGKESKNMQ